MSFKQRRRGKSWVLRTTITLQSPQDDLIITKLNNLPAGVSLAEQVRLLMLNGARPEFAPAEENSEPDLTELGIEI